ncbi:sorbitol dehydrogenase [Plakobranchus ocellatus]|uniref:Sorbitol dehydrogenase n=1 Tax=Plakobranchus ocellatus TaxID=259542 RepID=A0AAV4AIP3_9GAST|nr:sorbitol dehydrogenase [Plakobranchus ocellatus]
MGEEFIQWVLEDNFINERPPLEKRVLAHMVKNKIVGSVINLSSQAGRRGEALVAHYCATKAAVISYTQSAALAMAPYRIRVNAISPGVIDTPMWEQVDKLFASACAGMGIDSTPMEGIEPENYDKILGLENYHSMAAVAIGYRHPEDGNQPDKNPKSRRDFNEVITTI